jgi:hypothetical protein
VVAATSGECWEGLIQPALNRQTQQKFPISVPYTESVKII